MLNFSQRKIGIWSQSNGCFKSGGIWVLDIYIDSFYLTNMVLGQVYFWVSSDISFYRIPKRKHCWGKKKKRMKEQLIWKFPKFCFIINWLLEHCHPTVHMLYSNIQVMNIYMILEWLFCSYSNGTNYTQK